MTEYELDGSKGGQIESEIANALSNAGLNSMRSIIALGPIEISKSTGLSFDDASSIYQWACTKLEAGSTVNIGIESAYKFLKKKEIRNKISTGSKNLNKMLKGGIETSAVTEFFGPSGCGKTQFCFTLAVNVQLQISAGGLNGKVIYIDTEHKFSAERISQIASSLGFNDKDILENIQLIRPFDSSQQERSLHFLISLLEKSNNEKLIVIDSIISHYRSEFGRRDSLPERQHRIYKSMRLLSKIAELYDVAVVITNQIQTNPDCLSVEKNVSTGGNVIAHASTYRVQLSNIGYYGAAKIINSPCHPPAQSRFTINERGICDYEDVKRQ